MEKDKEFSIKEQKEEENRFFVFCVDSNNDLHNIILDYNESELVGLFVSDLMRKQGKPLQADSRILKIGFVKEEESNESDSSDVKTE